SKNFNSEVGIVLSLFEIEDFDTSWWRIIATTVVILWKALFGGKSYEVIFLEYGIDHPGDMEYLLSIVHPHMSIFTGLDKVHAEYFETIDDILDEKMKLLQETTEVVFVPATAQYTLSYTQDLESDVLTYALYDNDEADI